MADPFEALRESVEPVEPDPLFAAHLRARLARALTLPRGVTVSNLALDPEPAASTIIPYLIVAGAAEALDWYADAMGAERRGEAIVMADGRTGHSELNLGGATIYLADESPDSNVAAPQPGAGATVSLTLTVPDVDRLAERAVRAGAALERAPADNPYGRNAVIRDPFGHRWILSALAAGGMPASQPSASGGMAQAGDIAYASLWVPDGARAAAFFGAVLGWRFRSGSGDRTWQVEGLSLPHGISGGQERSTLFLCFFVDDLAAALEQVGPTGGQAGAARHEPYGRAADCVDDQGVRFALIELPRDARRGPVNGARHGDISYLTMEVVDSAHARAFYGSVLGWRFSPGRVRDGWATGDVVPMLGLHGGHRQATVLPMYRVDDIAGAVAQVRANGGASTEPENQPYGLTALCEDDQGTRFYLGQH